MPTPATATDPSLPPTCSVRNWVVFGPGIHKDEYYSPQRCRQVVANFDKYTRQLRHTIPRVALGHDQQQRFAKSLGFGNVGTVVRCSLVPGYEDQGVFSLDIDNIPTEVGGEINAGRLAAGSVELKSKQRDPEDPSEEIPGDLLTGIAFLGEEQPAIRNAPSELMERTRPRAVFANGRPVPPNAAPTRWLNAMADVTKAMALEYAGEYDPSRRVARIHGREFADRTVCFSDFDPKPGTIMTPDEIKAKLLAAGKTAEEVEAILSLLGTGAAPAVPDTNPTFAEPVAEEKKELDIFAQCAKYADDPAATEEQKMFGAMAKKFADLEKSYSEDKKRIGELQASADATRKKDEEAKEAAMSADIERAVAPLRRKIEPKVIDSVVKPHARDILKSKHFGAEADRLKAFSDYITGLASLPDDPRIAAAPGAAVNGTPGGYTPGALAKRLAAAGSGLNRETGDALAKRLAAVNG